MRRCHQHRSIWFEWGQQARPRRVARSFSTKKGLEFAFGGSIPTARALLISYGVADKAGSRQSLLPEVRSALEDVERLPSGILAREPDATACLSASQDTEGTITETKIGGETIRFFVTNREDSIMNFHYQGAFYETEELDLIKQHYTYGGTFVDIGANIGNHAIYISRFTKSPKIIVFEPNLTAISILKKNLALNHCKNVDTRFLGIALGAAKSRLRQETSDANNLGGTCYYEDKSGGIEAIGWRFFFF